MRHPDAALQWFKPNDVCSCNDFVLRDHAIFMFEKHPREHDTRALGENLPEWQPCPEREPIPFDTGAPRVAYRWEGSEDHYGEAVVMVYEGDQDGLWTPCCTSRLGRVDCWFWICKPFGPTEPCDNAWLRSISS